MIARAVAKHREDRFPSAGDLARSAQAAAEGRAVDTAERNVGVGAAAPTAQHRTPEETPIPDDTVESTAPAPEPVADTVASASARPSEPAATAPAEERVALREGDGGSRVPLTIGVLAGVAIVAVLIVVLAGGGGGGTSTTSTSTGGTSASAPMVDPGGIRATKLPVGVAASGNDVYIADRTGNQVIHGDATDDSVRDRLTTDAHPEDLVVAGGKVFVTVPDRHEVLVLGPDLKPAGDPIDLPDGSQPAGIATGDDKVWVSGEVSGEVYEIDPTDPTSVTPLNVGAKEPFGIGVTTDALWVADRAKDRVIRYDRGAGTTENFKVGDNPKGVAVAGGHVYVANADSGDVTVLSDESWPQDDHLGRSQGPARAIDVLDGRVWVSNGDSASLPLGDKRGWVSYFDESTGELEGKVKVKGSPEGLGVSGDRVWVATGPEKLARAINPSP